MSKKLFLIVFFLSFLSSQFCQDRELFNEEIYNQAIDNLKKSNIDESLSLFQKMINPSSSKEIWTCQALLVCGREDLLSKSDLLLTETSKNIIIIRRVLDSKECFRLCAGLFEDKSEAIKLANSLKSPFKEAKPYPLLLAKNGSLSETAFLEQVSNVKNSENSKQEEKQSEKSTEPEVSLKQVQPKGDLAQELFLKGLTAYSANDLKSAENYFRQSIAMKPSQVEPYNNLGVILLEQKRYDEAKAVLEQAVSIKPDYANSRANLAGAYWYLGMKEEAVKEAERAFKLDAGNVNYSITLASFLYELGRYSEAKTYTNVAKILSPDNPDIMELSNKIDEKLGIKEETKETLSSEPQENSIKKEEVKTKETESEAIVQNSPPEEEKKGFLKKLFKKKKKKEENKD